MARVAVVGAGIGGLAAALFLARRGHEVVVIERDSDGPRGDAQADFAAWRRPGVPQARHPHLFLGLAYRVLREEAPDVLDRVLAAGPSEIRQPGLDLGPGDEELLALGCRRMTVEPVLRAAALAEPGVTLLAGAAAEGLLTGGELITGVPHVTGVRTDAGAVEADLVVDAGGRRSALPGWLAELDARPPVDQAQELRFAYHTRWYQLPDGERPVAPWPPLRDLGYGSVLLIPADAGVVGVTYVLNTSDPLRSRVRDPDVFDRVLGAVDHAAPFTAAGMRPLTEVLLMARLENRSRRLVDDRGPVVTGLVAAGDAALYTNPTFGRGAALALAHVRQVAATAEQAVDRPADFPVAFDAWTQEHLYPWFAGQMALDAGGLAATEAALRGEVPAPDPVQHFVRALFTAAGDDPAVARRLARFSFLLDPPGALMADPDVQRRVGEVAAGLDPAPPPSPLPRARFEELVSSD